MSTKANTIQQNALISKRNGNTQSALLHMKRRQLHLNEIDRCSNSLLNLESGLHTLKRARSDVQVVKAYEMMNETMKHIRHDDDNDGRKLSMSHVENVMDEYHDHMDELGHVQDILCLSSSTTNNDLMMDEEELEKELLALGDTPNGSNDNDDGTKNAGTNKDLSPIVDNDSTKKLEKDSSSLDEVQSILAETVPQEKVALES